MLLAAALWMQGCSSDTGGSADGTGVVVSIYPLAELVEAMGIDGGQVGCLLPPGVSPHTFEPSAADLQTIRKAKYVVAIGLGLDDWAISAAKSAGRGEHVVQAGALLGLTETDGPEARASHDEHDHHDHGMIDPHVWLDPVLAQAMVMKLAGTIRGAEAGEVVAELESLDKEYREALGPYAGRAIVTYHSAFDRVAERYGLKVAATLEPPGAAGALSREALREAMAAIESNGLKVIFCEPQFPPTAVDMLVKQTGVKVLTLDPLGDPNVPGRAGYFAMMRYNLRTLVEGLNIE